MKAAAGGRPSRRLRSVLTLALVGLVALATALLIRHYLSNDPSKRVSAVRFPGGEVAVGVAITQAERRKGLAGRDSLPQDTGLLFVYDNTRPRRFTMAGMRFSLDIITLSGDGLVTGIQTRSPGDPAFDTAPAQYVLEVAAGWATSHGVTPGVRAVLLHGDDTGRGPPP